MTRREKKYSQVLNHNVVLNRRNCEIKSYNHRFRTRRENRFFFAAISALPVGCLRKLNLREIIVSLFPTIFHRERIIAVIVRWKDCAAVGSNYRKDHRRPLTKPPPYFERLENEISSEKIRGAIWRLSLRFQYSSPCFLPGGKTARSPHRPAYPSLSFFVTKRRITTPRS